MRRIPAKTTNRRQLITILCCVLILLNSAPCCLSRSLISSSAQTSNFAVTLAVDYLSKYGYLQSSDLEAGNLRTEAGLQEAIRKMQKFGNITETGVVDEATLRLMTKKRCGVPDIFGHTDRFKRYALQGQRWQSTDLTWSVKDPMRNTEQEMIRSQLSRAFRVWSDASILTFTELTGTTTRADIVVSFLHGSHGDGYPFDGEGAVLAHAFFPGEGIGGDAHFDAEERWLPQQPLHEEDGVNLFAVAAHEIGHSLGLSHSSLPGSLMFPYYQVVDGHFHLPEDDVNGIRQLYGTKAFKEWAKTPATYPTVHTEITSTSPSASLTTKLTWMKPTETTVTKSRTKSMKPWHRTTPQTKQEHDEVTTQAVVTTPTEITTDIPQSDWGPPPETCNSTIDAISVIRGEVFLFKGKFFWRLDANLKLKRGYPAPNDRFWYKFPQNIEKIDALYERPTDTNIVFFSGRQYWVFAANQLLPGYPRSLTDLGLPSYVDHIDAAMVWAHNGKTYFFWGNQYWKFDELDSLVELDYPRDIAIWQGVPRDLDAAFQWTDGNTYFFKGNTFWQFNDARMKINPRAGNLNEFWFGCKIEDPVVTTTELVPLVLQNSDVNRGSSYNHWMIIHFLIFIHLKE